MRTRKAIPLATRRAVALRAGAVPGEHTEVGCAYCPATGVAWWPETSAGRPGAWVHFTDLELDHVVPRHRGGDSTPENVVLACRPCNRSKGAKTLAEWRAA